MTDEELGLLLYAIELEENMLHKIGKAKAFGFGSCKIEIEDIKLDVNVKDKYADFKQVAPPQLEDKTRYIESFKKAYSYDNSIQKEDLMIIMNLQNKLDFSVSPFPEEFGRTPGKSTLNWFLNKKTEYINNPEDFKLLKIQDYK